MRSQRTFALLSNGSFAEMTTGGGDSVWRSAMHRHEDATRDRRGQSSIRHARRVPLVDRVRAMTEDSDPDLGFFITKNDLERLQFSTVLYYLHETNPDNGLVRDKTDPEAPSSIAAIGMGLAAIPVIVELGVLFRDFAAKIARRRLRQLLELPQGPERDASGYKGFFYHFLDIETGRRTWQCELSTIDSAFLFAGALTCGTYFDRDTRDEAEIRRLADQLYRRADWNWARNGGPTLTHGWYPETGFIPYRYEGYDEGLLRELPVETDLRARNALFRAALHPPALAHVDRLSWHPRRVHA
jgi:hypothetical protein